MGTMVILLVIDDGVYVCICKVYSSVFKEYTSYKFFYYSYFYNYIRVNVVVKLLIIDDMQLFVYLKKKTEKVAYHLLSVFMMK